MFKLCGIALLWILFLRVIVAYEQSLRDALAAGLEIEGELATTSLEFKYICIEKVDAKWWLAEMTLVMTSLPSAHVFQCLFTFALIGGNLTAQSTVSHRKFDVEFKFQRRSPSSPSFSRPAARAPRRACSRAILIDNILRHSDVLVKSVVSLEFFPLLSLNFIRLFRVVITPSVTPSAEWRKRPRSNRMNFRLSSTSHWYQF